MQDRLLIRTPQDASQSNIVAEHAPRLQRRRQVLMADPSHFRISYAINPHMRSPEGALQQIDAKRARQQWEGVRQAYEDLGYKVETIEADTDHPDLVFTANQAFPYPDPMSERASGAYCFVPSRMAHPERSGEVPIVSAWFKEQGYRETPLPANAPGTFESGGDLTWFGDRRLLVGGVSKRTTAPALKAVADLIDVPIITLEVHDPDFYHLDTCLTFLDDRTVLWVPHAFTTQSQKLLSGLVENLIAVDDLEARRTLAVNCHSPDGRRVLIHKENQRTIHELETIGYEIIEVDTSEFNKSGGSVFCLKTMMW